MTPGTHLAPNATPDADRPHVLGSNTPLGHLHAIDDRPDDDARRRAYADWLDRTGDHARAEFVRVQCRMDALAGPNVPTDAELTEFNALFEREKALLAEHRGGWEAEVKGQLPGVMRVAFRGGVPHHLVLDGRRLAGALDWLADRVPTARHLTVQLPPGVPAGDAVAALGTPAVRRLHGLDLGGRWTDTAAKRVADSPFVGHLTHLGLSGCGLTTVGVLAVVSSGGLSRLESLDVSGNRLAAGVRRLSALPPALRSLDLTDVELGDDELRHVASTACFGRLRELVLGETVAGDEPDELRNRFTAAGVRAVLDSPFLKGTAIRADGVTLSDEMNDEVMDRNVGLEWSGRE